MNPLFLNDATLNRTLELCSALGNNFDIDELRSIADNLGYPNSTTASKQQLCDYITSLLNQQLGYYNKPNYYQFYRSLTGLPEHIYDLDISPNSNFFITIGKSGILKIWNMDGTIRRQSNPDKKYPLDGGCKISPDMSYIVTSSEPKATQQDGLMIWNLDATVRTICQGSGYAFQNIQISPDSQTIVNNGEDALKIWNTDGTLRKQITEETKSYFITSDSQFIIYSTYNDTIHVTDINGNEKLSWVNPDHGAVDDEEEEEDFGTSFVLAPNDQYIVSYKDYSPHAKVRIWNLDGTQIGTYNYNMITGNIFITPNSRFIIVLYDEEVVVLKSDGTLYSRISFDNPRNVACSPNSDFMVITSRNGEHVHMYNLSGELMEDLSKYGQQSSYTHISNDGLYIIGSDYTQGINIWRKVQQIGSMVKVKRK